MPGGRVSRRIEAVTLPRLRRLAAAHPGIDDVRGRGAMLAVELVQPGVPGPTASGAAPDPARTAAIARACHDRGLLVLTCGTYGNVLRFLPPLVISEDDLRHGLDILDAAFGDAHR